MYKQLSKSLIFLFLALLVSLCFGSFVYAVDGVPEFLLTANDQHTIDVRLSRGDGTFAPPVSVGDDLGVNYGEFAIADFTGDGDTDYSFFRPSNRFWYVLDDGIASWTLFGTETDIKVPGDFNGDGDADFAFFRPSNGFWYVLDDGIASWTLFGTGTDYPLPVRDTNADGDPWQ